MSGRWSGISVSLFIYSSFVNTLLAALCTITFTRALQDLPTSHCVDWRCWVKHPSQTYRYTARIKPQLLWWLHSAVNRWIQVAGKLAGAAHFHSLSKIVKADWLHSKCDADFLHCQYVLINKLSKAARVGKKLLWRRMMRRHRLVSFFLLEPHFPQKCSHTQNLQQLFLLPLNGNVPGSIECVLILHLFQICI